MSAKEEEEEEVEEEEGFWRCREGEAVVIIMRDGGCVGVQGGERCQVSHLHMYGRRGGG